MSREWELKYRKLLDDENLSYLEKGKEVRRYRPVKLYRYMKFDEFWEKNIFEGQIYLSQASHLNDPFDCLIYVNHKEYIEYMFQLTKRLFPQTDMKIVRQEVIATINEDLDRYLSKIKDKIRLACFTENYLSPLMWAHYADSHRGFCLEFDLSKLQDGYSDGIFPVLYSEKRYDATKGAISKNNNILFFDKNEAFLPFNYIIYINSIQL